jgi:hypothetical protein
MRLLQFLAVSTTILFLTGCAGYHLGPVNGAVAGEKSIEVVPFNNQTLQPRLGDAVTQALRERLQTEGTYRLATRGPGDVVVTGVITRYNREGVSFLSSDVVTPQDYRVNITAHITACERDTGKVLLNKDVNGSALVHVGGDLADTERQSLPVLAEDLARNVAELLTEGAW